MGYEVRVTKEARQDIADYMAFICANSNYVDNAVRWFNGLEDLINGLDSMPSRFPRAQDFLDHSLTIHNTVDNAHRVLFSIHEEERIVRILRLLHTRRDPSHRVSIEESPPVDSP